MYSTKTSYLIPEIGAEVVVLVLRFYEYESCTSATLLVFAY